MTGMDDIEQCEDMGWHCPSLHALSRGAGSRKRCEKVLVKVAALPRGNMRSGQWGMGFEEQMRMVE